VVYLDCKDLNHKTKLTDKLAMPVSIYRMYCPSSWAEVFYTLFSIGNTFYQVGHSPNVLLSAQYDYRETETKRVVLIFET